MLMVTVVPRAEHAVHVDNLTAPHKEVRSCPVKGPGPRLLCSSWSICFSCVTKCQLRLQLALRRGEDQGHRAETVPRDSAGASGPLPLGLALWGSWRSYFGPAWSTCQPSGRAHQRLRPIPDAHGAGPSPPGSIITEQQLWGPGHDHPG